MRDDSEWADRDFSCSDKLVVTNCIDGATSNKHQQALVEVKVSVTHSSPRSSKPPGSSRVNVLGALLRKV